MTCKYKNAYILSNKQHEVPKPKKSLGQNFLQDSNIARKIVTKLDIGQTDFVVEIGPGPGALTGIIQKMKPEKLVLIEKDHHWAKERMLSGQGTLSVINSDAMLISWDRFSTPWKCIGNLPYNVASPLMWDIFSQSVSLLRAVFMIQKEVALRLTAKSGTSAYGALSVWVQSFMKPTLEFIVPPQVFHPRPKVDSAVVSFVPVKENNHSDIASFSPEGLSHVLKMCFQMRRKQLGTIFRASGISTELLEESGIDPRLRPENLSPADFHKLSLALVFK